MGNVLPERLEVLVVGDFRTAELAFELELAVEWSGVGRMRSDRLERSMVL